MNGEMYDAADAANREAEERTVRFIRAALENGGDESDARAACWCAGIAWRLVEPQRRAA